MVAQAKRQRKAANGRPVVWLVAEEKSAVAIRLLLTENNVLTVKVIYSP